MKRFSVKLLIFVTMTLLGVQPATPMLERLRRRHPVSYISPDDRYDIDTDDETSKVVVPPSSISVDAGTRVSPELRDDRDAGTTLHVHDELAKRRWNSGNLRVWGKRYSVIPVASSIYDDKWTERGPVWWLSAKATNSDEGAPVSHTLSEALELDEPATVNVVEKRQRESTKRRRRAKRTWKNVSWRVWE